MTILTQVELRIMDGQFAPSTLSGIDDAYLLWSRVRASHMQLADRYESALRALLTIQRWDCLNPPDPDLCADHPWLRRLVDDALQAMLDDSRRTTVRRRPK